MPSASGEQRSRLEADEVKQALEGLVARRVEEAEWVRGSIIAKRDLETKQAPPKAADVAESEKGTKLDITPFRSMKSILQMRRSYATKMDLESQTLDTTPTPLLPDGCISIKALLGNLGEQKNTFLDKVETRVNVYVRGEGKNCLAVIENKPGGVSETHKPGIDEYVPVFICFLMRATYCKHTLDSALSEPIAAIVSNCYEEFFTDSSEDIAKFFLKEITDNRVVHDTLIRHLATELAKKGASKSRSQIFHALSEALKHAAHSHLVEGARHALTPVAHSAAAGVAAVAGTTAGHMLGKLLYKLLASHIQVVTAKLLGSAAVKKLCLLLAKKFALQLATALVVKTAIAKLGIASAGATTHHIVLAAIAAFLAYKLLTLPKAMAKELGKGVRNAMDGEFESICGEVLKDLPKQLFNKEALAKAVVDGICNTPGWKEDIDEAVGGFPAGDKLHEDMEKDITKAIGKVEDTVKGVIEESQASTKVMRKFWEQKTQPLTTSSS